VNDVRENVRQFGKEVEEFASSALNPSSVHDPKSFRARELAGERRLAQRAEKLRQRIHALSGTKPVPTGQQSEQPADADPKQEMLDDLKRSEKRLEETRQKLSE